MKLLQSLPIRPMLVLALAMFLVLFFALQTNFGQPQSDFNVHYLATLRSNQNWLRAEKAYSRQDNLRASRNVARNKDADPVEAAASEKVTRGSDKDDALLAMFERTRFSFVSRVRLSPQELTDAAVLYRNVELNPFDTHLPPATRKNVARIITTYEPLIQDLFKVFERTMNLEFEILKKHGFADRLALIRTGKNLSMGFPASAGGSVPYTYSIATDEAGVSTSHGASVNALPLAKKYYSAFQFVAQEMGCKIVNVFHSIGALGHGRAQALLKTLASDEYRSKHALRENGKVKR